MVKNAADWQTKPAKILLGTVAALTLAATVELVPLACMQADAGPDTLRPHTPLELAGRAIYMREGCQTCHSQMVRVLPEDVARYGPRSRPAESRHDRPALWGFRRIGPDLARVGAKHSDQWHRDHLADPRSVVPQSVMPAYPWLGERLLDARQTGALVRAYARAGAPYTPDMIERVQDDLKTQTDPEIGDVAAFEKRYPKAVIRDPDDAPARVTELAALIAYLQSLGARSQLGGAAGTR